MILIYIFGMTSSFPLPSPPGKAPIARADQGDAGTRGYRIGAAPRERITSAELLHDRRELEITHQGSIYRLRVTSTGKLILTK